MSSSLYVTAHTDQAIDTCLEGIQVEQLMLVLHNLYYGDHCRQVWSTTKLTLNQPHDHVQSTMEGYVFTGVC